jgi:glucokinase
MTNKFLCGVDIGGTKLSTALLNHDGSFLDKMVDYDHVEKTEIQLVEQIAGNVRQLLEKNGLKEDDIMGIGIGSAGHIRFRDGVIITTSNLKGFKNYPLRDAVQAHFNVPVILDNDANAQAFGEYKFGAGKGCESMVFLTISTGIGAGIIIDGKLYRGYTGTAGEFGHTIVEPSSEMVCTCGNNGCLMAVACGMALPHLFRKKIEAGEITTLNLPQEFDCSMVDGKFLKEGLDLNDPLSKAIILDSAYYVGLGLYNIFQVLNPQLIVLGGGLLSWGDFYLNHIKKVFYNHVRDMLYDPIDIAISQIGSDVGVIGAASLTLELC